MSTTSAVTATTDGMPGFQGGALRLVGATSASATATYAPGRSAVTDEIRRLLPRLRAPGQADLALYIADLLDAVLSLRREAGLETGTRRPMSATVSDDGSLWLEWATRTHRVGFVVASDRQSSSWFMIDATGPTMIPAAGSVADENFEQMVAYLVGLDDRNT